MMRRFAAGVAVLVSTLGMIAATNAPDASAYSQKGCSYPYVCFYKTKSQWDSNKPSAMFKDMNYWQTLGPNSRGAYGVVNTRNDDSAKLKFAQGGDECLRPNESYWDIPAGLTLSELKIIDSSNC